MTSLKHRLSICLLLLLPLALACGEDSPVGSTPGPGTKGPKVLSITPANGANNVPTNTSVVITFSDMMESTTLADTVLFLTPNRGSRVSVRGDVVTLELPILAPATDYTVTVTTAATDTAGNHLATQFTSMFSTAGAGGVAPQFVHKWGAIGSANGEFLAPAGVAVDGSGNVYVADFINNRIQKFSSTGTFVTEWGKPGGSFGSGDGEFNLPTDVAVDAGGNVYVADSQNHRIQKFDPTGTFLAKVGTQGTADGQLNFPWGVAVDASGNIYVTESDNNRCQKFDATMTFVAKWGSLGSGDGQFKDPQGIAVNGSGDIYVADTDNSRIQQFK